MVLPRKYVGSQKITFFIQPAQKCSPETLLAPNLPLLAPSWEHFGPNLAPWCHPFGPNWPLSAPFCSPKSAQKPPEAPKCPPKSLQATRKLSRRAPRPRKTPHGLHLGSFWAIWGETFWGVLAIFLERFGEPRNRSAGNRIHTRACITPHGHCPRKSTYTHYRDRRHEP